MSSKKKAVIKKKKASKYNTENDTAVFHLRNGMGEVSFGNFLSKRELFAAMAMMGMLVDGNIVDEQTTSKWAVAQADALIGELNK